MKNFVPKVIGQFFLLSCVERSRRHLARRHKISTVNSGVAHVRRQLSEIMTRKRYLATVCASYGMHDCDFNVISNPFHTIAYV